MSRSRSLITSILFLGAASLLAACGGIEAEETALTGGQGGKADDTAEGQFCGGIAGFPCPEGYTCALDGDYPDAGGTCVKESAEGQFCGGIAGFPCPEGYACALESDYPDAGGTCVKHCSYLDEAQCNARTDCEWKTDWDAFPGPISGCYEKQQPETCDQLDKLECALRPDCEWKTDWNAFPGPISTCREKKPCSQLKMLQCAFRPDCEWRYELGFIPACYPKKCYVGGCSGEVCSDEPDVVTPCIFPPPGGMPPAGATCAVKLDGTCGWVVP